MLDDKSGRCERDGSSRERIGSNERRVDAVFQPVPPPFRSSCGQRRRPQPGADGPGGH